MTDFKRNWNNIKNTWKGIKSLISLKTVASSIPTVLSLDNGDTITSPYDIANTFNNYFASIAETTEKSIKYSHKHFSDYLSNESDSTIFLQPTDKEEIANIRFIQPLFHDWCFSFCPPTAKVVPVFKKDSKLDYSNYHPISLLSNIEKILEKLMYKRFYTFLNNNNIIYNIIYNRI